MDAHTQEPAAHTHPQPPQDPGNEPDGGTAWVWLGVALVLLLLLAGGLYVLSTGAGSDPDAPPLGRPADKPHLDGLIISAEVDSVMMRTYDGETLELTVTDENRANIDIPHAQEHSATGQATRAYYQPLAGSEDEWELLFFDDAPVPASLVAGKTATGTVTEVGDDVFTLDTDDGEVLELAIAEEDRRVVRAEHVELHAESGQPARVGYEEREGQLWATHFVDLPLRDWMPER